MQAQPVVLAAMGSGLMLLSTNEASAQSAESVAKIAEAITVRIEGATQGSGILIGQNGNRYTVLTAWHVIADQKPGEELAIFTADGKQYQAEPGSIKRIPGADMAELSFLSDLTYSVAQQDDTGTVSIGSTVFVAGFPVSTSAVPQRLMRLLEGRIIASPNNNLPNGYRLLYSNPTMPGMSGGPILSLKGRLIGIHARSEVETQKSDNEDVLIKTGTGQGVPISYLRSNTAVMAEELRQPKPPVKQPQENLFAQAQALAKTKGREEEAISILDLIIADKPMPAAYFLRAQMKEILGRTGGAESDLNQYVQLSNANSGSVTERGKFYFRNRLYGKAIDDFNAAVAISPDFGAAYYYRGLTLNALGSTAPACDDFRMASSRGLQEAGDSAKKVCIAQLPAETGEASESTIGSGGLQRAEITMLNQGPHNSNPVQQVRRLPFMNTGVVRFGDTVAEIARRYGMTIAELLRLNPGLETARLVIGSQVRLAQSGPIPPGRPLLGLNPVGSGGTSSAEIPQLGPDKDLQNRGSRTEASRRSDPSARILSITTLPILISADGSGEDSIAKFAIAGIETTVGSGDQIGGSGWIFRRSDSGSALIERNGEKKWIEQKK